MRAKCAIENISGGRQAIIVTEIPYQVNKMKLIERIADLVNDGVITDIARDEFRDESDRDGMRIVIGLKRGSEAQIVLNQLYKHTQMQESFSMIFLAVVNGQPRELPLPDAIRHFIDHRVDVVRRRTAFLLRKAREREHILLGYQIALDHLDNVIKIIRGSSSRADARENLFRFFSGTKIQLRGAELKGVSLDAAKYGIDMATQTTATLILSYRQIDAILELQLYRLTQLSIDELLKELQRGARQHRRIRIDPRLGKEAARASSSRSWSRSARTSATSAAPRSSTKPPSCSSKTSSPTSRSPSRCRIPAT